MTPLRSDMMPPERAEDQRRRVAQHAAAISADQTKTRLEVALARLRRRPPRRSPPTTPAMTTAPQPRRSHRSASGADARGDAPAAPARATAPACGRAAAAARCTTRATPSAMPSPAARARGHARAARPRRTAVLTARPPRRAPAPRPATEQPAPARAASSSTSTSALTIRTTRPWMIVGQVRGQLGLEDRRVEVALRRAAEQRAEQQRRRDRADRRVAPEQRDRDAEEADRATIWMSLVAMPELPAEHVERAGQPGEQPADGHHEDVVLADAHAAVAGGLGVEADRAHLVADRRAVQEDPEDDHRGERDEEPDVQALQHRVAPEHGQLGALHDVVGDRNRLLGRRSAAGRRARTGRRRPRARSS